MHVPGALPLLLVAAPATLLASPMHQQQNQIAGQQQPQRQPTVYSRSQTRNPHHHHHPNQTQTKSHGHKRHHLKLDAFFGHVLHPECAPEKKDECDNCGDDISCEEDPDCEWCYRCVWEPVSPPDVAYCNSTMARM
ncbi:hypothetical protein PG999_010241 [Apiospora kogelbergensis]|uniref:Uncharacterized protein n=1 Tax=Apiospora kogelbergensis TaxID=1337665 RepID=A0AAW0QHA2_9PEZI